MASKSERLWLAAEDFPYTVSQVKRAGDHIRRAAQANLEPAEADLVLLDLFRASHYPALRHLQDRLVRLLHKKARLNPQTVPITARPLKTREAIIAKLVRDGARLNRIQDIAGARIVVPTPAVADSVHHAIEEALRGLEPEVVKDTRDVPDAQGYRALHLVVWIRVAGVGDRPAEIQIRNSVENTWAQIVERLDSIYRSDLKHGRGPAELQEWLVALSAWSAASTEPGEATTIGAMPPMPPMSPRRS